MPAEVSGEEPCGVGLRLWLLVEGAPVSIFM